ncbi:ArsR/SmtB family transcription factor [Prosthecodimorpha staleyi]|uniref:ArsR family transcriptional regulator n=1 Tax=Prosthecodimorpha staleyi TaxID=2840188 RepID=A0A947D1T2_9HYPH|nr:helix-turn-helix transcriptional regulator [Prosthecodimorpha staleyi]MBT9289393.1 ArsR family transcriptional regulator [Prosthecodimorpha staleyi]
MREGPDIATLAAAIGDPARAGMLDALMSGLALSAGELAREAGITPPTASAHLAHLRALGIVVMAVQGRHRYFRLAGAPVAEAIESLMGTAARLGQLRTRPGPRDAALRQARICYDHLAGKAGTDLFDTLAAAGHLAFGPDGLALTASGAGAFLAVGLDVGTLETRNRPACRACVDWSERRDHLAGALGAAVLRMVVARDWARREPGSRALGFTPNGQRLWAGFLDRLAQPTGQRAAIRGTGS